MPTKMAGQRPKKETLQEHSQQPGNRAHMLPSWVRSPWFGYVGGLLLVGAMVLLERLDQYLPSAPLFVGTPFGMVSVLVALIWGLRPALFSIAIGLIAISRIVSPGLMTPNIGKDIVLVAPFIAVQIVAVAAVIRFEVAHRRIRAAQKMTQAYVRELETANQRLVQTNEQLERANYLKDYVIIRSSHEFRTPMTTILGRTQLTLHRLKKSGETPENWSALRQHW